MPKLTISPPQSRPQLDIVTVLREQLKDNLSGDYAIYQYIDHLTSEVDQIEDYRRIKAQAKEEINALPDDVMSQLFRRVYPLIKALPTAHSQGHCARDLVNITVILHDPETATYDDVEILVGILAGVFHDIGNSVIERDDEGDRFTLHAEVGAWLFGKLAGDIVPQNLLKLIQFAIAAHTDYQTVREKTKNGLTVRIRPYNATIVNGDKRSLTLVRTTDRSDLINGAVYPVRTIIRFAKYIKHVVHVTGETDPELGDEMADFQTRFSCDKAQRGSLINDLQNLVNNNATLNAFNRYDTPYIQNEIFLPNSQELQHFVDTLTEYQTDSLVCPNTQIITKRFMHLCELLEPGQDISERLGMFSRKFNLLSADLQCRWAAGFKVILDDLYPQYYARIKDKLSNTPIIAPERGDKVKMIINDIANRAIKMWEAFDPDLINQDPGRSSFAIGQILTDSS